MAGQAFTSGAVEVFVETINAIPTIGANGAVRSPTPMFLGVGKVPPRPEVEFAWFNVMNDLAGDQLPYDYGFAGAKAVTAIELTTWIPSVLEAVQAGFNFAGEFDISWLDTDLGSLMMTEGFAFKTYYRYKRRSVPAMSAQGMPAGRCYWGSRLLSVAEQPGNKENSMFLVFGHQAIRDPATTRWTLRTSNMAAVNNLQGA